MCLANKNILLLLNWKCWLGSTWNSVKKYKNLKTPLIFLCSWFLWEIKELGIHRHKTLWLTHEDRRLRHPACHFLTWSNWKSFGSFARWFQMSITEIIVIATLSTTTSLAIMNTKITLIWRSRWGQHFVCQTTERKNGHTIRTKPSE